MAMDSREMGCGRQECNFMQHDPVASDGANLRRWKRSFFAHRLALQESGALSRQGCSLEERNSKSVFLPEGVLAGDFCTICVAKDFPAPHPPPDPFLQTCFSESTREPIFMEGVICTL